MLLSGIQARAEQLAASSSLFLFLGALCAFARDNFFSECGVFFPQARPELRRRNAKIAKSDSAFLDARQLAGVKDTSAHLDLFYGFHHQKRR